MSQPGRNRIEELYEAQPREGVSTPHQTGSDQQGCLSESWPCFSGNAIDDLGFRISLYGLIDQIHQQTSERQTSETTNVRTTNVRTDKRQNRQTSETTNVRRDKRQKDKRRKNVGKKRQKNVGKS